MRLWLQAAARMSVSSVLPSKAAGPLPANQGRDAVEKAHRAYFEMMFRGVKQRLLATESLTPLPGGGAVVVACLAVDAFRQPNGVVKPPSEDRLTLVMVPRGDDLAIVHGANVEIVAEAQRHDPVAK